MQAFPITQPPLDYNPAMQTGRPSKRPRSEFGKRLHATREALGLSQAQVADKIGITQSSYADWERYTVALRPEQLTGLAEVLQTSVEDLLGVEKRPHRGTGPSGKMRRLFEAATALPRGQQQKIIDILQPFVRDHAKAV
jgi:transcriptional regulator with XRE-family HTH domain